VILSCVRCKADFETPTLRGYCDSCMGAFADQRRRIRNAQSPMPGCFAEINDDVIAAGWKFPGKPLLPADIGMDSGLLAEEYYRDPESGEEPSSPAVPGCGGKCGGCAGNPVPGEGDGDDGGGRSASSGVHADGLSIPDAVSPLDQDIAIRRAALATLAHARSRGTVPAGLRAWAEAALAPPRVDWRRRLAGLARAAPASIAGATDFTWRRQGRRSLHSAGRVGWPLCPALHQPRPKVAVVLDTSGSMGCPGQDGRALQEEALSEVLALTLAAGGECRGYACDAGVHAESPLAGRRDLGRLNAGGGGTDMVPGFLAALKRRPDLIVIVTDGLVGGGWPDGAQCRGRRVLAVLVGEEPPHPPSHIPFVEAHP